MTVYELPCSKMDVRPLNGGLPTLGGGRRDQDEPTMVDASCVRCQTVMTKANRVLHPWT